MRIELEAGAPWLRKDTGDPFRRHRGGRKPQPLIPAVPARLVKQESLF